MAFDATPYTVSPITLFMAEYYSDLDMTGVPTGFHSFFTRPMSQLDFVWDSLNHTIDIVRGESRTGIMLPRQTFGSWDLGTLTSSLKGQRWKNYTRNFPIMPEYMHIGFDELFNRVPGENPISTISSSVRLQERLRMRMAEQMGEALRKLMRRQEIAASESIRLGTITLDDSSGYDFERSSNLTFNSPLVWTNTSATPITYIDTLCERVHQNGKKAPNFMLLGDETWAAFIARLAANADVRNYHFIKAGDQTMLPPLGSEVAWMAEAGFDYVGYIQTDKAYKLAIFTYKEQYQAAATGTWTDLMPADECTVGYANVRNDRAYGPRITFENSWREQEVNQLLGFDAFEAQMPEGMDNPGVFDPRMFHIDAQVNNDNTAVAARIITGPIHVNTSVDCFGTMQNCV